MCVTIHIESACMMVVAVQAVIGVVAGGQSIIVVTMVVVNVIDAECPVTSCGVDRAEEVFQTHEQAVLCSIKNVAKILVAIVQIVVVAVDGIGIAIYYVIHEIVSRVNEVIVHFEAILVLSWRELQFVGHSIGEKTCSLTHT